MKRHLPAIILRDDVETFWTMASACGTRGPLAARDASEGGQAELINLDTLCPECLVTWDAAEEHGGLRAVWYRGLKTMWAGPGAVLNAAEPSPWKCPHCKKATGGDGFKPMPATQLAVVVRDQRPVIVRR